MPATRRRLILGTTAFAAAALTSRRAAPQTAAGPFKLPPLSDPANAFEPSIDSKTMEIGI